MKTLLLLFVISLPTYSQVQVQVVDENLDTSSLDKRYKVNRRQDRYNAIPDKEERDAVLGKIKSTQGWDELKKDIFFMDLKSKSIEDLVKKYPEISLKQLRELKQAHE